jgi:hypothetical protein
MLQAAYDSIVKQFHLNRKSEFRAKMGATEDPIWICYPNVSFATHKIVKCKLTSYAARSGLWWYQSYHGLLQG